MIYTFEVCKYVPAQNLSFQPGMVLQSEVQSVPPIRIYNVELASMVRVPYPRSEVSSHYHLTRNKTHFIFICYSLLCLKRNFLYALQKRSEKMMYFMRSSSIYNTAGHFSRRPNKRFMLISSIQSYVNDIIIFTVFPLIIVPGD